MAGPRIAHAGAARRGAVGRGPAVSLWAYVCPLSRGPRARGLTRNDGGQVRSRIAESERTAGCVGSQGASARPQCVQEGLPYTRGADEGRGPAGQRLDWWQRARKSRHQGLELVPLSLSVYGSREAGAGAERDD